MGRAILISGEWATGLFGLKPMPPALGSLVLKTAAKSKYGTASLKHITHVVFKMRLERLLGTH